MKEETKTKKSVKKTSPKTAAKKTTAKKVVAKKTTASSSTKVAAKKVVAKKPAAKKEVAKKPVTKKAATAKKASTVKKVAVKKSAAPKVEVKKEVNKDVIIPSVVEKKEEVKTPIVEKKEELNKDLITRAILVVSFTLIFVILIIGLVDFMSHPISYTKDDVESYIVSKEVLKQSNIIDIKESKYKLNVLNGDYFIYISYKNKKVNEFEEKLVNLINKYDLKDKFYYVDISSIVEYDNRVDLVNKYLGYTDVLVSKVPTIIYVNSDNVVRIENIITRSDNKMMAIDDFQKLLDINNFKAVK